MSTLFITGTDTGVGKTTLTGLLLAHLRASGIPTLGMKPFCSGSRHDAVLIRTLIDDELTLEEINPFYFTQGIAPWAAARLSGRQVSLEMVIDKIKALQKRCELLIIEGAGGLLSPLGEGVTAAELISGACDKVIVVAANKLGVLNHAQLTAKALPGNVSVDSTFVLIDLKTPDESSASNGRFLSELLAPRRVFHLPYLSDDCENPAHLRELAREKSLGLDKLLQGG